jgi:hypothetical protein
MNTQPAATGFAAGATDTGHEGGSFAPDANDRTDEAASFECSTGF